MPDSTDADELHALEAAVFRAPDDADLRRRLAVALRSRKRFWEATEHLTQAVRLDPDDTETVRLLLLTGHREVWGRFRNVRVGLLVFYVLASAWIPVPFSVRLLALFVAVLLLLERRRRVEARRAMLPPEVAVALHRLEFQATWGVGFSRRTFACLALFSAALCALCTAASFSVPVANQPAWLVLIAFTGGVAYWAYRNARSPKEQQRT